MKKQLLLLPFFAVIALTSCKKEVMNNQKDSVLNQQEIQKSAELSVEFVDKYGNTIDGSVFRDCETCIQFVTDHSSENYDLKAQIFPDEAAYKSFLESDKKKYARPLYDLAFAQQVRDLAQQTGDDQLGDNDTDTYSPQMTELLNSYNPPAEFEGKATGILWDNANYSGTFRPVYHLPVPSFTSFNNKAESYQGAGVVTFFMRTWYRGKTVVLFGITPQSVQFFSLFAANDIESRI